METVDQVLPGIRGEFARRKPMRRAVIALAAVLVAMVVATPVWAHSSDATIWLEYKGTQVLCADPGMPSTEAAVNVEAFGGFPLQNGSDSKPDRSSSIWTGHIVCYRQKA